MKQLSILVICLLLAATTQAQYVNIPDSNFRNFLMVKYPACFNASKQMDTTCGDVVNEKRISFDFDATGIYELNSIYGFQYFKSLKRLNIDRIHSGGGNYKFKNPFFPTALDTLTFGSGVIATNIDFDFPQSLKYFSNPSSGLYVAAASLPNSLKYFKTEFIYYTGANAMKLPDSLQYFEVSNGTIDSIDNMPDNLEYFNCNSCKIQKISSLSANLKYLYITNNDAYNLVLPAFPFTLLHLDCNNSGLKFLPALPANLKHLNCSNNSLTVLPTLPNGLDFFDCSYNVNFYPTTTGISTIPNIPTSIKYFDCRNNIITSVGALPNGIETLNCSNNRISTINNLPNSLLSFICNNNNLIALPNIPNQLKELNCSYNKLTNLPAFPSTDSFSMINCGYNLLTNLPTITNDVKYLYCNNNALLTLPTLSTKLIWLNCSHNRLTTIPTLPNSLVTLYADSNRLQAAPYLTKNLELAFFLNNPNLLCLPYHPINLKYLGVDTSAIECLPNTRTTTTYYVGDCNNPKIYTKFKVCNETNNKNNCLGFPKISGNIYLDLNTNNKKDISDYDKHNAKIYLSNGDFTYSDNEGNFEIVTDSIGSFTVTITNPNLFNSLPADYTHNFTSYDTLVNDTFALQPTIIKDSLALTITPINWRARPGFSFPYSINYENIGTTVLNPTLNFSYDSSKLIYDSSNVSFTNTGNNLNFNIGNMVPGYSNNFIVYFKVKTTVPISDSIVANASLTSSSITVTEKNVAVVTGAFDPNDKQATTELSTTEVAQGKKIDYTIRFQNTGNDTAFHVVIADTLDSKLDFTSLQIIATSHNCKTTIKDNIIFFEMRNIMLPDSNVNYLASTGFIRFTMQPKNNVVAGDNIPNKAAIYFDYNAPVITNTAITQIKNPLLPVTFMSYILKQAQDNKNEIENTWITANEVNLSHYIVQRSDDGRVFKSVGKVDAVGVSSYTFIDNKLSIINNTKTFYYRVIAADKNGNYQFTEVRQITINEKQPTMHIYPNPAKDIVNIGVDAATTATIVNAQGQIVKSVLLQKGSNNINITSLPNGVYYLKTENTSTQFTKL